MRAPITDKHLLEMMWEWFPEIMNRGAEKSMSKEESLKLIKLLSALESWSFSTKERLPDYLLEDLCLAVEKLEKIVLEEKS